MQWVRCLLHCISCYLTLYISARQTCFLLLVVSTVLCSTSLPAYQFVIVAFSNLKKDICISSMGFGFSMWYVLVSWGVASSTNRWKSSKLICVFFTCRPGPLSSIYRFWTDFLYYIQLLAVSLRTLLHTASTVFYVTWHLHLHIYRNLNCLQLVILSFLWSIHYCLCIISCGCHLLFSLSADVHVFNISCPLFCWSYARICRCSWCPKICLGIKFLCFVLYTYCICLFQVCICGAPSLKLVLLYVAHLPVIILPLVLYAYLVQHSHPCVFLLSDSLLIFVLFFFTLSNLLTSSVPCVFASLWNTFLCCKIYMPHFSKYPML